MKVHKTESPGRGPSEPITVSTDQLSKLQHDRPPEVQEADE